MADINQVITLGIGTPADVPHFVLVGLSASPYAVPVSSEDVDAAYSVSADLSAAYVVSTEIDGEV